MRHGGASQPPLRRNRGRARCDSEYLFSFLLCKKIERKPRAASFAFQIMDSEAGFICLFLDPSADGLLFLLIARLTCDVFHRSG